MLVELGRVDSWLDSQGIADGTPFLMGPGGVFDVVLNGYFGSLRMVSAALDSQEAAARDLARFFDFLWFHRPAVVDGVSGGLRARSWRGATVADRQAFEWWRCRDEDGPLVAAATWDREVASANGFYRWAASQGHIASSPIAQRPARGRWHPGAGLVPAEYRPDGRRDLVAWLTPAQYRRWRDVGVRGFEADALPDPRFRGRMVARNAVFCDLMVRTGLRLREQASLTVFDIPDRTPGAVYHRGWLPAAIAKYGSARSFYVPDAVARDLATYVEVDRLDAVLGARRAGRYERIENPLIVEDPSDGTVRIGGRRVRVERLDPRARIRLLVRTPEGLEPAALWLGEDGVPLQVRAWKSMFRTASARCARLGVGIYGHAHKLRHSFAVVTLEHLQRGHIKALSEMNPQARRYYQQVFGDPLDWIRRRLGHRSVETTQKYLHMLAELEMQTRLALVGDAWTDPRLIAGQDLAADAALLEPA